MAKAGPCKAAKLAGKITYFTGMPCKHGHIAERYVCDNVCVECKQITRNKLTSWRNAYSKEWYNNNKQRKHNSTKIWRTNNKEKSDAIARRCRDKNREKINAAARIRRAENWPQVYEVLKRWRKNNKEQFSAYQRAHDQMRKSKKRGMMGRFSREDVAGLLVSQNFACVYCKKDIRDDFHLDHIMPCARGGQNYIDNIQALCPTWKGSLDPSDFKQKLHVEGNYAG